METPMDPIEQLAKQGDASEKKIGDNKEALDKVWAATFNWSAFLKTPVGQAVAGLAIAMLMAATAWVSNNSKPAPVAPVNVVVHPVDQSPLAPSPIIPPSKSMIRVYVTAAIKDTLEMPGVSVDPKVYEAGSSYPFNGKVILLPCYAVVVSGAVVEVVSFATKDEIVAASKKVNQ